MSFIKQKKSLTEKETAIIYNAESINIIYETKPEIIERILPKPLEPFEKPIVRVYIANFPRTNFGCIYKEAAMMVLCQYKGAVGAYVLSMPVDNDMAMALGREFFGYPKKMAEISFKKDKKNCSAWVERDGIRFVEIEAKIGMKIPEKLAIKNGLGANKSQSIVYNFKHFIAPDAESFDYNPRLIKQPIGIERFELKNAKATIELQTSTNDPWHELELVKQLGAFYSVQNTSMLKAEVVAEVTPESFYPYSFLKWDESNI